MKALHSDTVSEKSSFRPFIFCRVPARYSHQVRRGSRSHGASAIASSRYAIDEKGRYGVCCVVILMTVAVEVFTFSSTKTIDDVLNNHFPPPDKDIVSVIHKPRKDSSLTKRQEKLYPPPSRTTCENYPKPRKSKKKGQGKTTTQKPLDPLQNSKREFQQMEVPSSTEPNNNHAAAPQQRVLQRVIGHG
ncbi:hypothetical protein ACJ73_01358 [Blastomyces percursus]|uniref:Uncharacterized protein n=1 Tax=Blastomyces percursus TaxID=1658174 RepID=A0A1J9QGN1_9EURO|nr:hypothetical protein ACJ73_01358 [Blastomyces percursus]